jgi:hypothetical protein
MPNPIDAFLHTACALAEHGQFDKAAAALHGLLTLEPANAAAMQLLSLVQAKQGDLRNAARTLFEFDSILELELQGGQLLGFCYLPELPLHEMLVYTSALLQFDPLRQFETALRLANARSNADGQAQTGIQEDRLVMAMHLPARAFDLPLLDRTVNSLLELQEKAAAAV